MMDDQVTAAGFARGLLDPGLSPRAFGAGSPTGRTSGWAGAGDALRQLGLHPAAEVREHDLVSVLGGRHTGTGVRVLTEPAFYDLTFTAPNSVSFAWTQLDAGAQAEIEQAVLASAGLMLTYLTTVAPLVDGMGLPRSFVAALVLHAVGTRSDATGPIPPILHVHSCLFAVQDADGTLLAPHEPALAEEDVQRECDAAAGADLGHRLVQLGYRVRNTAGAGTGHSFELDGVPAALLADERFWRNTGCGTATDR